MKTAFTLFFYTILTVFILLFTRCTTSGPEVFVTDIDGNVYPTCTIGNKVWMAANLRVTRYRNGDPVPLLSDSTAWNKTRTGAYCFYNNDTLYNSTYGKLYNGYAINDPRKIAPEGWHIATNEEITTLIAELEKDAANADKLKTNGLGGYRFYSGGTFHTLGFNGYWWAAGNSFEIYDHSPRLFTGLADVQRNSYEAGYGMAIRCVKD
jgi:uncharacterized protein (TIGR02145 family)